MKFKKLIIDLETQTVYDDNGFVLGRTGDTKMDIDVEKAKIHLTVNMTFEGASVRLAADKLQTKQDKPLARSIRL